MSVHHESSFEDNIEAHLVKNGWARLDPWAYDKTQGLFATEYIEFVKTSQESEWQRLVTIHGSEASASSRILRTLTQQLERRGTIDVLRGVIKDSGVTLSSAFFKPANTLTPELLQRYEANRLGVVRQLHHSESRTRDSLDLVLVVNGIPVATAELKNPLTAQNVEHAMEQYRSDRNPTDLIFRSRTLVHFAVDPHRVYMTTKLAGDSTRFLPFNRDVVNPPVEDTYASSYLWTDVWQRDAWLDLLETFVHSSDGVTLFPRYHQWDAVRSIVGATRREGVGPDRLIQHSAGSGKSNTIAWTAHSLSRLHDANDIPIFDKVIVITDRVVLDRQLQQTVSGFDHTPGTIVRIDQNSAQLRTALAGHTARIIITTLQKFPVVAQEAGEVAGRNFAVIVDEAHSSTSGEAIKDMKRVLGGTADGDLVEATDIIAASAEARAKMSNLSFFAFTATPKEKTLNLFGEAYDEAGETRYRPFHLYSMRQAIEEGFILDVLQGYTTYTTYYKLASAGPDDPEVPVSKAKAALARFVTLHEHNLGQKAEVIVEHFRQKVAHKIGGKAKAMVVTRSRLHAVRYQQAITAYIESNQYPLRVLVAFSGSLEDPDQTGVAYTEAAMNGFGERELPQRFASDGYHLLIVAEKYQTGFDQPLLHTMYVDKKLSGVQAVQTLSRLNRTHPGKDETFVLDFANEAEEIQQAFAPFYTVSLAEAVEPSMLYNLQHDLGAARVIDSTEMRMGVTALLSADSGRQGTLYASLSPAVERFGSLPEEDQEKFRTGLQSYVRAYAFIAQVISWTDRGLEELYLYGKALLMQLPSPDTEPLPLVSKSVQLTHLRTVATSEQDIELVDDTPEPGQAFPGGGEGKQHSEPMDRLSALLASMNETFGMNLGEADKVWFEQQRVTVEMDDDMKVIALNNDREQYRIALEKKATDLVVERQEANGVLFDTFFENPQFRHRFLEYLAGTYDDFRARV